MEEDDKESIGYTNWWKEIEKDLDEHEILQQQTTKHKLKGEKNQQEVSELVPSLHGTNLVEEPEGEREGVPASRRTASRSSPAALGSFDIQQKQTSYLSQTQGFERAMSLNSLYENIGDKIKDSSKRFKPSPRASLPEPLLRTGEDSTKKQQVAVQASKPVKNKGKVWRVWSKEEDILLVGMIFNAMFERGSLHSIDGAGSVWLDIENTFRKNSELYMEMKRKEQEKVSEQDRETLPTFGPRTDKALRRRYKSLRALITKDTPSENRINLKEYYFQWIEIEKKMKTLTK
eukprot:snap_masked-scaffold_4-processed-gene-12.22-mRNA-1 protein AED:1.00 eAED:1.00 QI:0/-1/0/0/-1/1/1/0/288